MNSYDIERQSLIDTVRDICPGEIDYLNAELEDHGFETLSNKEEIELLVIHETGMTKEQHFRNFKNKAPFDLSEIAKSHKNEGNYAILFIIREFIQNQLEDIDRFLEEMGR